MANFRTNRLGTSLRLTAPSPSSIDETGDASGGLVLGPLRSSGTIFWSVVVVVVAAALFQNLFRLSRAPLLFDESTYQSAGWRYAHWGSLTAAGKSSNANNFEHPPLAKILFGVAQRLRGAQSITVDRGVAALCTLVTALLLALWIGNVVDRWAGLLAGGMLALIPMSVAPELTRFGRTGMLDPVAEMFMVASVVLAWYWFNRSGPRAWFLALATGVCVGLSSASKENGFLGAFVPVAVGLVWSCESVPRFVTRLTQAALAIGAALSTFVVCYLPFGQPFARMKYLLDYQSKHSHDGHVAVVAGHLTAHPPWWANLWYAGTGIGPVLTCVLPLAVLAAIALRRDRVVVWCSAALAAPFLFHSFLAAVVLPFYWAMWTPAAVALAAIGMWESARRAAGVRRSGRTAARIAVVLLVVPVLAVIGVEMRRVATLQTEGAATVPVIRADLGLNGTIVTAGTYIPEMAPYLPDVRLLVVLPKDVESVDTVLLGQPRCRTLVDRSVRAFVSANLQAGSLRLARTDRLLRIYVRTGPLRLPTTAEIAAEPVGKLTDNC